MNYDTGILIIEDDLFIRATLRKMLRSLGCSDVRQAGDGSEALALLEGDWSPGIILCDVRMEPMDGLTFLRELRANTDPQRARLPVIMLTGAIDESVMKSSTDLGVSSYLLKPVSSKMLAEQVTALLCSQFKNRLDNQPVPEMSA